MATLNFTETQASFGFFGYFDLLTDTNERHFIKDAATWTGYMTGTEAKLFCSAGGSAPYNVSIDDGTPTTPTLAGGEMVLFTGLSDTAHLVRIMVETAYSGIWNSTPTVGNLFEVTGANPSVSKGSFGENVTTIDSSAVLASVYTSSAATNVTPTTIPTDAEPTSLVFTANCTKLFVFAKDDDIMLGIDNEYPVKHSTDNANNAGLYQWREIPITLSAGNHEYMVVTDNPTYGVMVSGGTEAITLPSERDLWRQIGDSITEGNGAEPIDVDTYKYCFKNGVTPGLKGDGGYTTQDVLDNIDDFFITGETPNVVVIAAGRNDYSTAETSFKTSYTSLLDAIIGKGVTYIKCRGMFPATQSVLEAQISGWIKDVVDTLGNTSVEYIDTSYWLGILTADGTHPTAAGYVKMADYEVPVYDPNIPHYTEFPPDCFNDAPNKYKAPDIAALKTADANQNMAGTGPVLYDGSGNAIPRTYAELIALPEINENKQLYGCDENIWMMSAKLTDAQHIAEMNWGKCGDIVVDDNDDIVVDDAGRTVII